MKWLLTILAFFSLLFLFISCVPDEKNVPFETIELQFETPGADRAYKEETSKIQVVSRLEDVTTDGVMISPTSQQVLMGTDYDKYLVVIAYYGWIGTTGYGIEIKQITQSGQKVKVYAELTRPKPDQLLGLSFTSPYHIVRLNRKDVPSQQSLTFLLYTDNRIADRQEVFLP